MNENITKRLVDFTSKNPDVLGEFLRDYFFDQSENNLGCYSTFDVRDGIEKIPFDEEHFYMLFGRYPGDYVDPCFGFDDNEVLEHGSAYYDPKTNTTMCYYWDGDGSLAFKLHTKPNKVLVVYNDDCKHKYGWEFSHHNEVL